MRDEHRLRERVEISLDNRQIFLLFFASAVVIALVFALGVVVGKRLVPAATETPPTDPLALLDQMGEQAGDDLTFPEALTRPGDEGGPTGSAASPGEAAPGPEPAPSAPAAPAPPKAPAPRAPAAPKAPAAPSAPQPPAAEKQASGGSPAAADQRPQAADEGSGGEYTLQLSAFQDRREAEQFAAKLQAQGLRPRILKSNIPDKGIWYRVRLGSYKTWDEAVKAKATFERDSKIIAYVTRR